MRCLLSKIAEDDLEAIADYIACENPRRTLSHVIEIRDRCHSLVAFPEAAPLREEYGKGIRRAPLVAT